ncbi:MAG: YjgP/YjgQ family permease [Flavobacteriales bacterium]|nr:YjgP/YjgQ family permease [Flavobacteriales bacterium]
MKKLSKLIIKSFLGPFALTFVLILFILLMQFVWKYLDDLMGKGLEWTIIAELLIFQSTNLVALALPLSILLSSIMTFGNLAENYELVALKSSGLSLLRIMRPLIVLIIVIAIGAFFFSNRVTPYANLKSKSLLHDIVYHKPLMDVKEGVFYNGMAGFSIRINQKNEKTGELGDILIYDHRLPEMGNARVIRAKKGKMRKTISGRYLIMDLYDGISYDEQSAPTQKNSPKSSPHLTTTFDQMELRIDVSSLQFQESDEEKWTNNIPMQDMSQLSTTADSLKAQVQRRADNLVKYTTKAYHLTRDSLDGTIQERVPIVTYLDSLPLETALRAHRIAYNMANNSSSYLQTAHNDMKNRKVYINKHWNEWHRKLTLSLACVLLFFIGGPLGAIIKKGGLGMPVVFSIVFFLIFHITSISGEKMVNSGSLEPYQGMWLSSLVLLPFALFLTYKAANDSQLFDSSAYGKWFSKFKRGKKGLDEDSPTVS